MRDFRSLQVWEKSHRLALEVYRATQGFPPEERYGLTSQLRRASASVPSNIAEGCGRDTKAELVRFLHIAAKIYGLGLASNILKCDAKKSTLA